MRNSHLNAESGIDLPLPAAALLPAPDCRGALGRLLTAVACFGAGGGLRSPGTKSKISSSLSRTPFRSARVRPSARGIHVPRYHCQHMWLDGIVTAVTLQLACKAPVVTLIFAITSLHLLMHSLLDLALQNPCPRGLVKVCDFQDVRCVDPVVGPPSHDMIAFHIVLVYWYL